MSVAALSALAAMLAALAAVAYGPSIASRVRGQRERRRAERAATPRYDPGRELRAERKARELLRSVVGEQGYAMYRELGFLSVAGGEAHGAPYAYLLYPHRPIVAYDTGTGELLNEYCVRFPDRSDEARRLPDADDVLAKWMSLRGGERALISDANMHLPGRQVDPGQVRRDLQRLRQWRAQRDAGEAQPGMPGPREATA